MRRLFALLLAFALVSVCAFAQNANEGGVGSGSGPAGVPDDSYYTDGDGNVVHIDVTQIGTGVSVTATDGWGFSSSVPGRPGADTPTGKDTCASSGVMNTPGASYRISGGKVYKKGKDHKYHKLRKIGKPQVAVPNVEPGDWR